ncbi:MAG: MFS transporter [Pseudothermotoga sp.]|nr:MFS transporter [Pseudothermotoga sp.]
MKRTELSLYIYTFLTNFAGQVYGVIFNLHMRRENFTNQHISTIVSANLWGSAVLSLILAAIFSKINRRKLLIVSNVCVGILMILRAVIKDYSTQVFLALGSGAISSLSGLIFTVVLMGTTESKKRYFMFGSQFSVSMVANVLGNVLGGAMGDKLGYLPTLSFSALLQLFSSVALRVVPARAISSFNLRRLKLNDLQKRVLWYYILSNVLVGFGAGLFLSFSNLMFHDLFGISLSLVGLIMALAQIMTAIGSLSSGFLQRKFGAIRIILACYTSVVPLMLMLSFVRNLVIFSSLYVLRFMLMNMVNPSFTVLIFNNLPEEMVMPANGFGVLLSNSSRALAAYLYGLLVRNPNDYGKLLLLSCSFYAMNALITWRFKKKLGKLVS